MAKMHFAQDAYALNRPGAKASMYLPKRSRFVIVVAGESPRVMPITETGTWEIDTPPDLRPDVEWPVLVMVMPKKHAELFAKLTGAQATDMVRASRIPTTSH